LAVTISNPATGATLTNPAISVSWTASPEIVMYRVIVYEIVGVTEVITYDSGYVVRSESGMTIQPGFIPETGDFAMYVYVANIDGSTASDSINFSTNFAYAAPSDLNVSAVGMCGPLDIQNPYMLPRVIIDFDFPTKSHVNDFYDSFIVYRQEDGGDWIPIHRRQNLSLFGITFNPYFEDATVCSGHTYKYKIALVVNRNSGAVSVGFSGESAMVSVDFQHAFIHAVRSPIGVSTVAAESVDREFDFLRFESHDHDQSYKADMSLLYGSGRRLPTPRFSEQRGRTVTLQGLPGVRSDRRPIEALRTLVDAQSESGAAWCLRLGRDQEKIFVAAAGFDFSADVKRVTPSLNVTEIFYTEDLRAYEYGLNSSLGAVNYRIVT